MPNQRKAGLMNVSAHVARKKVDAFDRLWKERNYASRSAALDKLMTLAMTDQKVIDTLLRLAAER